MLFWYMYNVSVQFSINYQFSWRKKWKWLHSMYASCWRNSKYMYQIYWNLILRVSFDLLFLWSCFRNVSSAVSSLFSLSSLSVPHHPCNIIQTVLWPSTHKGFINMTSFLHRIVENLKCSTMSWHLHGICFIPIHKRK